MATVLVLGGGFGGLAAATTLRSALPAGDEVVLIDGSDRFAMGFAKLWDLAGTRPLAAGTRSLHDLTRQGITFVNERVTGIDGATRRVTTASTTWSADALVIALGSVPAPAHRELLAGPDAHDLYDPASLPGMRAALDTIDRGRVVISILGGPFKCPPAPYEAALIVDRLLRDRGVREDVEVVVTTPQPIALPAAGVDASAFVASHLAERDVVLHAGVRVTAASEGRLTLAPAPGGPDPTAVGDELAFDLLLGVPADTPPPVVRDSSLTAPNGWLEPDPATFGLDAELVYAVGDCTRVPTASAALPHAGVFAAAQGEVAARNIAAALTGSEPVRFDGHGYCFLELPDEQVAFVEGDFYADPPQVTLAEPDHEQFRRKQAYEREHLDAWFGTAPAGQ